MELTVTVNGDQRYYPDEKTLDNPSSIIDTIINFNNYKMFMYNRLYDMVFLEKEPFKEMGYDRLLRKMYGTNSYYNTCIYSEASKVISSQKELRRLYKKTAEADIKARKAKIKTTRESLDKKLAVKDSIRTYIKIGKWIKPYPKCAMKVCGNKLKPCGSKEVPLAEYERKVEDDIRKLKNRLAMLNQALKRKEKKLANLESLPPKRVIFGTKDAYRSKDSEGCRMDEWKDNFSFNRHRSMSLPGRHTSKDCNFLVYMLGNDLHVKCMDGKETVFRNFALTRYQEEYKVFLSESSKNRKPVCYNFQRRIDEDGREYIIPSVTMTLEKRHVNSGIVSGCVSIDQNWDNITISDIDENGKCLMHKTIPFQLEGKTSGQISAIIGNAMKKVGDYCRDVKKCLVIEDIDTTIKRHGMKYVSRKGNRHSSMFAYRKISACAESQGFQKGFEVYKIDPAYTSQIAKIRYMRQMGCSIHEAASYTIGLKAMGMVSLLSPPELIRSLLPEKLKADADIWEQWKYITKRMKGVRTHLFYGKPPEGRIASLKKPTIASYAKALKDRDTIIPV